MNKKTRAIFKGILSCCLFTGLLVLASALKFMLPLKFERYAYGIIGITAAFISTGIFLKMDKKSLAAVGLQWRPATLPNFFKGLIIGLIISCIMLGIIVLANGLKVKSLANANIPVFFAWGMSLLLLSFMEEVAFRTYALVTLKNEAGPWTAQIVIAILFALYHVAGGQSLLSSFTGPGVWAFIFGWAVLKSGGIAMATGIHFAANIFQAAFGQKKQYGAIWQIDTIGEMTAALQSQVNTSALLVQLALLLAGIILTYRLTLHHRNKLISWP